MNANLDETVLAQLKTDLARQPFRRDYLLPILRQYTAAVRHDVGVRMDPNALKAIKGE